MILAYFLSLLLLGANYLKGYKILLYACNIITISWGIMHKINSKNDWINAVQRFNDLVMKEWKYCIDNSDDISIKGLIEDSKPISSTDINFNITYVGDDIYIDIYVGDIESSVWVSSAENRIASLWFFLFSLKNMSDTCYYYCAEEGPESFIIIKRYSEHQVRFIHLSNKVQDDSNGIVMEDYKIRQDFIVDKSWLEGILYEGLKSTISKESEDITAHWMLDEYEDFVEIHEHYLKYIK